MRKILAFFASIALILLALYPNVYLGIVQVSNELNGVDSLVDANDLSVALIGENLKQTGESPEEWVMRNITWTSDYDLYYNLEYWARPDETIMSGRGDCEDRAILTKSLNEYLEMESDIVVQLDHVYILKDGEDYFGVSETTSTFEMVKNVILKIPFIRKIVIVSGLVIIWGTSVYLGRQGPGRYKRRGEKPPT